VRSVEKVNLPRDSWGKVWRVSTGDVVMLSLGPLLAIGLAVSLFLGDGGGNALAGFVALFGGMLWFWIGLRTIRRSRLWLTLPSPPGH
jgi:hypothetical protein